ncbi:hypothetical protein TVAG_119130 [Trichomonas vaginalis G3]|uniref:HECT domain-containing protein n=1 Tax=Trichomonas vaginalis (strain ATCC PRA-98 / G3) TaxID=412133 RepID=A2D760_TRIV3|nr:E3 ubiquitin-protein ligase trip12 family [Trichomonas vaginalis G3]EAY23577.1 hypothetical protein TVAG_119130 [Trichomonas vaginalis G3]KAI5490074.1 E3 ubiquitin-protein ligase trip12 family [Trichomonas vaginalis G3]|eukprot:XP_001276825.1 hypothetical protein [Trichomonas vaginalis G3]
MTLSLDMNGYSDVIRKLRGNSNEVMSGLEILSNLLIFGGGSDLGKYNVQELCALLVNVIRSNYTLKHKELSGLCIHNLIETLPLSSKFFIISNVITVVNKCILDRESNDLVDTCIQILNSLSKISPGTIGEKIGIECFVSCFDILCPATQRVSLQTLINVANELLVPSYSDFIVNISHIMSTCDDKTLPLATQSFILVLRTTKPTFVPREVAHDLIISLPKVTDDNNTVFLLKALQVILNTTNSYDLFLENIDFFNNICYNPNTIQKRTEIVGIVLDFILSIVPPPNPPLPKFLWPYDKKTVTNTNEFTKKIQPLIINLIKDRLGSEDKAISALTATLCMNQPPFDQEFVTIILGISQNQSLIPNVLGMLLYLKDLAPFAANGFLNTVDPKNQLPNQRNWVNKTLNKLRKRVGIKAETISLDINIKTMDDVINLASQNLPPFELISNGVATKLTKFLTTSFLPRTLPEPFLQALQIIADQMKISLTFYQLPEEVDPIGEDFDTFSDFGYPIDIIFEDHTFKDISVDLTTDLVAIEAWVNQQINPSMVNEKNLKRAMNRSDMSGIIYFQEQKVRSCSTFGYLARSFGLKGYKEFTFSLDGKVYPALEPFWHVLTTAYDNIDSLLDNHPTFVLKVGDCQRPSRKFRDILPQNYGIPLALLSAIKNIAPTVDCCSNQISNLMLQHLSCPSMSSSLYNEAVNLFYSHPFLFNFESRFIAFLISSLDMPTVLHTVETQLTKVSDDRQKAKIFKMKVHANRNKIVEDGKKILQNLPATLRIDVDFVGEMGFGIGPTQEFYTLLSREFCRPIRGLWRNSDPESEFVYSPMGLFPSPVANPKEMRLFGILCARAIAANCLIDVPLSESFFKYITYNLKKKQSANQVTIDDIDPTFASSLNDKEGLIGLDFTYPGLPNLELKKGGKDIEVTAENVDEYVSLVKEFTISGKIKDVMRAFKDGFSQIIPYDSLSLFSPKEIIILLCGSTEKWTKEYLAANVKIEHGYNSNSAEINNLFEILSEMNDDERMNFVNFVTGSSKLPIGGLANLRPKLTIARKDDGDNHLPSVMTCTNYFKMPAYSSKEVMREKILFAISNGRGVFSFS